MEILTQSKKITEDLLKQLNIEAEIITEIQEGDEDQKYLWINIRGENVSDLIGFHGKNLESVQTIISLALSKELNEENLKLIVEVNDYRSKRVEYIKSIASRVIAEVKETKQNMELSPMKPFERRIIHIAVKEDGEVESESVGEGYDRRIVIKYKGI